MQYLQTKNSSTGVALLIIAAFIGSAKTAYFYLPTLVAIFIFPKFGDRLSVCKFLLLTTVCQAIAFCPVYFSKTEKINSYHSVYFGALKTLKQEEAERLDSIGEKPILHECIGTPVFNQLGINCMENANASYADVARLVFSNPKIGSKMVSMVLVEGRNTTLNYLGKGITGSPNFHDLGVFNIIQSIFLKGYNIAILIFLGFAVLLLQHKVVQEVKAYYAMLITGVFLGVFGFSQYLVALGDGFYEITKHLIVGNYTLALAFPFLAPTMLLLIGYRFKRNNVMYLQNPVKGAEYTR
jgi:hypothetical protein